MEFAAQELIILIIFISIFAGGILSDILKLIIKIALYVMILALLLGIAPGEVVNGMKAIIISGSEIFGVENTVSELIDTSSEWVEENKDGWLGSAQNLRFKLLGIEKPEE